MRKSGKNKLEKNESEKVRLAKKLQKVNSKLEEINRNISEIMSKFAHIVKIIITILKKQEI